MGFLDLSTSMTLNEWTTLNPQKRVLLNFSQFLAAVHISTVNCDKMAGDRPRQPAYLIFSIECRFYLSKSGLPTFKEVCAGLHQWQPPPKKVVILPVLAGVAWKRLQIGTDMLPIITSNSDKLFIGVTIDEIEWPWAPKIGGFNVFLQFLAAVHADFKSELRRNGWR